MLNIYQQLCGNCVYSRKFVGGLGLSCHRGAKYLRGGCSGNNFLGGLSKMERLMCGLTEQKKPRLFYYDEAAEGFIPVENNEVSGIIDVDQFHGDGNVIELKFKRIDMTDTEFNNMPEVI